MLGKAYGSEAGWDSRSWWFGDAARRAASHSQPMFARPFRNSGFTRRACVAA